MIKVLLDTNVILDVALERQPFFDNATKLFELNDLEIISKMTMNLIKKINSND